MTGWHPGVAAAGREDRLLRPDQVALRLHCSVRTVRRLCREKLLCGIKAGRRKWLIPMEALVDYVNNIDQE
jgi:excisionase family DNA binding protein